MTGGARQVHMLLMGGLLLGLAGIPLQAQQTAAESRCRPDEIDMGDYCASMQPPTTQEESDARRVTPFRSRSMMPGRTGATDHQPGAQQPIYQPGAQAGATAGQASAASTTAPDPQRAVPATTAETTPVTVSPAAGSATVMADTRAGVGVQFGVFSSRAAALKVAQPLADAGLPVRLARLARAGRVLWACIYGPFPDMPTARAAARKLTIDHGVEDTYIKALDDLELTELNHVATEE
jgi:hypothetical protein